VVHADAFSVGVIGTDEAARRLGLSIRRISALIRSGALPAQKIARTWVLDETDVDRFAKLERKPGRPRKKKP
jgi:excisionase family DNA binding protein